MRPRLLVRSSFYLLATVVSVVLVACSQGGTTLRSPAIDSVAAEQVTISIDSVLRPATEQVVEANLFNARPEDGQEYVRLMVRMSCDGPVDTLCRLGLEDAFALVDARNGTAYEAEFFLIDVPGAIEPGAWLSGTVKEGAVFFIVDNDATDLVLRYEVDFIDEEYVYLALP